ncbi:hypothetical protein M407DRAFT_25235 [Tulasnella calospora MUT 4182]|uniref:DUF659 domain-containing protein n=1 Tax=Tulasnella calospora MUT 4182 TaxID=1051891 RepID=A0A0C3QGH7_9AGAM|nr:hypothetical protein M407DRAFT_25235 [Tulasnella calospora MUT 4182]
MSTPRVVRRTNSKLFRIWKSRRTKKIYKDVTGGTTVEEAPESSSATRLQEDGQSPHVNATKVLSSSSTRSSTADTLTTNTPGSPSGTALDVRHPLMRRRPLPRFQAAMAPFFRAQMEKKRPTRNMSILRTKKTRHRQRFRVPPLQRLLFELYWHLPESLPLNDSFYSFPTWGDLDPELVSDTGSSQGALNVELERTFGSRSKGTIKFGARGPSLEGVVTVLRHWITGLDGENILLTKWVDDLTDAAKELCDKHGVEVPRQSKATEKRAIQEAENAKKKEVHEKKAAFQETKKELAAATKQVVNHNPADLTDNNTPKTGTGRPSEELLDRFSQKCNASSTKTKRFRCKLPGCSQSWAVPRSGPRIMRHIESSCPGATESDKKVASTWLASKSLASQVSDLDAKSLPQSQQSSLKAKEMREPNEERQVGIEAVVRNEGLKQQNTRFNHRVLRFICAANLPPSVVDYVEWREMIGEVNQHVSTLCGTSFSDTYIPREAAKVLQETIKTLKKSRHLTLTFDGATTASIQSVYTVHVTTGDTREAYLIAGNEASSASHTSQHLRDVLTPMIRQIGPTRLSGIGGDGAKNVEGAKDLVVEMWPWIVKLTDPCHHLSNTGKDLGKLEHFEETIANLRKLLKFFKHSSSAKARLDAMRVLKGVPEGLVSVGKTRFLTFYYSARSVIRCLPLIRELISKGVIEPKKDSSISWMQNVLAVAKFEAGLTQLKTLLEPLARAVKCLESSLSTPADVYLFWLAVAATYRDIFRDNSSDGGLQLPDDVISEIRAIVNTRYQQMIEHPSKQVYLATFFLDPSESLLSFSTNKAEPLIITLALSSGYARSAIMAKKNPNPIAGRSVHLRVSKDPDTAETDTHGDADLRETFPAYIKAGKYLFSALQKEINGDTVPAVFVKFADSDAILDTFRSQFAAYARGSPPFSQYRGWTSPVEYWCALLANPNAEIIAHLAVKFFSLVPNSMAEERTISNFTKLNSPDRACQKVSTLVQMTQVRQHYMRLREDIRKSRKTVAPKWRDLGEFLKPVLQESKSQSQPSKLADQGTAEKPLVIDFEKPAERENTTNELPAAVPQASDPPANEEKDDDGANDVREDPAEEAAWSEHENHQPLAHVPVRDDVFEFEKDGIDLTEPYLRDVLSEKPIPGADRVIDTEKKRKTEAGGGEGSKKKKKIESPVEF